MNIKSTSVNPFKWLNAKTIFGDGEDYGIALVGTIGGTFIGIIVGIILATFDYYDGLNVLGSILATTSYISIGFVVLTVLSLVVSGDFARTGWNKWFRILFYNIFLVSSIIYSFKNGTNVLHEKVTSIDLVKTDIKGCTFNVRMASKNLTYELCSDDNANFAIYTEKPPAVFLVGKLKFGKNKASSLEYLDKHITIK